MTRHGPNRTVVGPPLGRVLARRPRRRRDRRDWPLCRRPGLHRHAGGRAEQPLGLLSLTLRRTPPTRSLRTIVRVQQTITRERALIVARHGIQHGAGPGRTGATGAPGRPGVSALAAPERLTTTAHAPGLVVRERALRMVREHHRRHRELRVARHMYVVTPPRTGAPAARPVAAAPPMSLVPAPPADASPASALPPAPAIAAPARCPTEAPTERAPVALDDLVDHVLRRIERRAIAQRERLGAT